MKTARKTDTVRFTTKGQVVIPMWLRKQFHIENGTRAIVTTTNEGILLRPVTPVTIRKLRGLLKRKPGDKSLAQQWTEYKAEEKSIEEAKDARAHSSR